MAKNKEKQKLPCEECGGRCCTYAPFHKREWLKIKERFPIGGDAIVEEVFPNTRAHGVIVWRAGTKKECYFLKDGRCRIYTYRPSTCRKTADDGVCAMTNPEEVRRRVMAIMRTGHRFLAEKEE